MCFLGVLIWTAGYWLFEMKSPVLIDWMRVRVLWWVCCGFIVTCWYDNDLTRYWPVATAATGTGHSSTVHSHTYNQRTCQRWRLTVHSHCQHTANSIPATKCSLGSYPLLRMSTDIESRSGDWSESRSHQAEKDVRWQECLGSDQRYKVSYMVEKSHFFCQNGFGVFSFSHFLRQTLLTERIFFTFFK